ncbi:hypothetical protein DSECCO2_26870 [anaerobic digester metagenome]
MKGKSTNTCGFTLVEVIVSMLVMGILFLSVASVFFIGNNVFKRAENVSVKQGTITNTEVNIQKALPIATGVYLSNQPNTELKESYSIGFKLDGSCEEVIVSLVVDQSGAAVLSGDKKQYVKTVNTIDQISEIGLLASRKGSPAISDVYIMNYDLIPKDTTMSTVQSGVAMNNIKSSRNNISSDLIKASGKIYLNDNGGTDKKYLVLLFDY